jgi:uncharacterized coiled-coil protein SlyX
MTERDNEDLPPGEPNSDDATTGIQYIVSELLCYVCQYMRICTRDQLIKILNTFYNLEEIVKAKTILHDTFDSLGEFAKRKTSIQRSEKSAHVEDVVSNMFDLDSLGADFKFVALDLRRIPKWDPTNLDNFAIAEKLSMLEGRLSHLELTASENKVEVSEWKDRVAKVEKRLNNNDQDIAVLYGKTASYSDKVKHDMSVRPSISGISVDKSPTVPDKTPDLGLPDASKNTSFVARLFAKASPPKQVKVALEKTEVPKGTKKTTFLGAHAPSKELEVLEGGFQYQRSERLRQARKRAVITGTGRSTTIRGGPPPIRQFFVHRVVKGVTEQDIKDYLSENDIVFNDVCILSKLEATFSSFRVSVPINMVQKIMDGEMWPEGIRVRKYFPPKSQDGGTG